jgi:hypothetical protein
VDKQWFNDEMNKIIVPQPDVSSAVKAGIARAQKEKPVAKGRFLRRKAPLIAAALFIGFLGSGFVIPQMNHVLAKVPIIGEFFSYFSDSVGKNLAASKLVTEINQKAVSNGVGVTVDSMYYDAGKVGVIFNVDNDDVVKENSKEFFIDFKLGDGSSKWHNSASMTGLITPKGNIGNIIIDYPEKELPANTTLPLTITSINSTKGTWKFDIPINQLDSRKVNLQQSVSSDDNQHEFKLETITIGKESAAIDYKAIHSLAGENDVMRIDKVTDEHGKEILLLASGIEFGRNKMGNSIESEGRSIIEKIPDQAKFLMIYPFLGETEPAVIHPLDDKSPFEMHSTRSNAKLTVNHIQHNKSQLIVQYTLDNTDSANREIVGEGMNLIDSSLIGKDIVPIGHIIKGSTVKVLNSDKLQFQATFKLDGEYGAPNFSLEGYSLEVPLAFLLPEKKLPPIKINLN